MEYRIGNRNKINALSMMLIFSSFAADILAQEDSITRQWVTDHYTKREVMVEMRDGVKLFTQLYEPKDNSTTHPVLMSRTCYSCMPYGERFMDFIRPGWKEYVRQGYIIVFQDVRGKNMSEGTYEDIRPFLPVKKKKTDIDEASDTYDTAEWIVRNTHSNKCIGVHGISYPGFYSTMAALSGHPAIKAVSPQAPVTDWFRGDDDHHNGALALMDMFSFEYWFQYLNNASAWKGGGGYYNRQTKSPSDIVERDIYTDYLQVGPVKNFTALYGDSVTFWSDAARHPNCDEWWEARTVTNFVNDVKPAVMVVGGLFDAEDCYGAFSTYSNIRDKSPKTDLYIVMGPWGHGAWRYAGAEQLENYNFGQEASCEYYMNNIEYPFFAYYLEGKGEKPEYKCRLFDSGTCEWINYRGDWEKETTKNAETVFYLQPDGLLCSNVTCCPKEEGMLQKAADELMTRYVSDPFHPVPYIGKPPHTDADHDYMISDQRFASWRPDVATFQTAKLTDDLTLVGVPEVEFHVSISTTDADFIVKLIDVKPDGTQMLVRWEIMRGKYRNSMSNPQPFVPGEPTLLRFRLNGMSHTFQEGHRVMVQVQSSMFPLFDRNPQKFCNIYTCDEADFQPCEVTLHHSTALPSKITIK